MTTFVIFSFIDLFFFFVFVFFFFQAEDGIRDGRVTGVQTCALPIAPRIGNPNDAVQIVAVVGALVPSPLRRVAPAFRSIATGPNRWLEMNSNDRSVVPVPTSPDAVGNFTAGKIAKSPSMG